MDKKYLETFNLKQNLYTYKIVKPKRVYNRRINVFIIFGLLMAIISGFKMINLKSFNDVVETATYIQNPISPLYFDMGNIVFTNGLNIIRFDNSKLEFILPIKCNDYKENNNGISFYPSNDPILKSIESGVVSDIFYDKNGVKTIKIKHSKNVYSYISNIDILGTHIGAIVNKGQTIGTIKQDMMIDLKIEINNEFKKIEVCGQKICLK